MKPEITFEKIRDDLVKDKYGGDSIYESLYKNGFNDACEYLYKEYIYPMERTIKLIDEHRDELMKGDKK